MDELLRVLIVLIFLVFIVIIGWWLVRPVDDYIQPVEKKYFLAAGAIFKNEAHILKEWLDHHKLEGFEHIWLVNDNSTDNYLEILQPYIDDEYVTLYDVPKYRYGLSQQVYTLKYILYPIAKQTTNWFIANDLDEFITTRDNRTVSYNLKTYFNNAKFIRLDNIIYGSNHLVKIPDSAINAYNLRANLDEPHQSRKDVKTLCRPEYVNDINIHWPGNSQYNYIGSNVLKPNKINANEGDINDYKIVMYHYKTQSLDFWRDVKMARGDADSNHQRLLEHFYEVNAYANKVTDTTLKDKVYYRPKIDIVLARYNEDLDWLNDDEIKTIFRKKSVDYDIHLYVYNCGKEMSLPKIPNVKVHLIEIENKGMGIYKFLTHIINNYDNLAQMTMLIPGSGWHPNKADMTRRLLKGDWNSRVIYTNIIPSPHLYSFTLDNYTNLGCRGEYKNEIKLKPSEIRPFGRWYETITGRQFPSGIVKTNYVDIIGFSRQAILDVELDIFKRLRDTLDDVHTEASHYIERTWYLLIQ